MLNPPIPQLVERENQTSIFFYVYEIAKTECQSNEATVHRRAMIFSVFVVDIGQRLRLQRVMEFM